MKNKKLSDMEYEVVKQHSVLAVWELLYIVDYMKTISNSDRIKTYLNKIVDSSFLEMKELINERDCTIHSDIIKLTIKGLCCVALTLVSYEQYGTLSSLEILIRQISNASYAELVRYEKILLKAIK